MGVQLVVANLAYYDIYEREDEDLRVIGCLQAVDAQRALLEFRKQFGGNYGQLVVLPTLGLGDRYFD